MVRKLYRSIVLLMVSALAGILHATEESEYIQERIEWLMFQTELSIDGQPILSRTLLPDIYAANDYQLLWRDRARFDQLVDLVDFAYEQGLDREDYALRVLAERLGAEGLPEAPLARAELDLLATEILVRIAYQLRFGKVNPYNLFPDWNFDRELLPGVDPVDVILDIVRAERLRVRVTQNLSRGPLYAAMVAALAEHRALAEAGGWPAVPAGPTMRLHDDNVRVGRLRQRLHVSGDLPAAESSTVFDADLEEAVRRFQARHGLAVDGVVGDG